jgi:hypothetical protein
VFYHAEYFVSSLIFVIQVSFVGYLCVDETQSRGGFIAPYYYSLKGVLRDNLWNLDKFCDVFVKYDPEKNNILVLKNEDRIEWRKYIDQFSHFKTKK